MSLIILALSYNHVQDPIHFDIIQIHFEIMITLSLKLAKHSNSIGCARDTHYYHCMSATCCFPDLSGRKKTHQERTMRMSPSQMGTYEMRLNNGYSNSATCVVLTPYTIIECLIVERSSGIESMDS